MFGLAKKYFVLLNIGELLEQILVILPLRRGAFRNLTPCRWAITLHPNGCPLARLRSFGETREDWTGEGAFLGLLGALSFERFKLGVQCG